MEPAFHRGDLLFLTNNKEDPIRAGEIVVFKVEGRDIPIVHRVLKLHEKYSHRSRISFVRHYHGCILMSCSFHFRSNGTIKFLTKGDNNSVDDRGLYAPGQQWLTKDDVVGRAQGFLPYIGLVTIYMNEYPKVKVSNSLYANYSRKDDLIT